MGNIVNAIPFEGECCFHPILYHIHHVTLSRDSVVVNLLPQPPTQIVNQSLNTLDILQSRSP